MPALWNARPSFSSTALKRAAYFSSDLDQSHQTSLKRRRYGELADSSGTHGNVESGSPTRLSAVSATSKPNETPGENAHGSGVMSGDSNQLSNGPSSGPPRKVRKRKQEAPRKVARDYVGSLALGETGISPAPSPPVPEQSLPPSPPPVPYVDPLKRRSRPRIAVSEVEKAVRREKAGVTKGRRREKDEREKAREAKRLQRALATEEEKEAERLRARLYQRQRRQKMAEEKKEAMRERDRLWRSAQRALLPKDELCVKQEKDKVKQRRRREEAA